MIKSLYYIHTSTKELSEVLNIKRNAIQKICYKSDQIDSSNWTSYQRVKLRRKKLKILGVIYKGKKCQKCGYNKTFEALVSHHINPSEKEFTIAYHCNASWQRIKKELNKCELLCSNCHREIHRTKPYLIDLIYSTR